MRVSTTAAAAVLTTMTEVTVVRGGVRGERPRRGVVRCLEVGIASRRSRTILMRRGGECGVVVCMCAFLRLFSRVLVHYETGR